MKYQFHYNSWENYEKAQYEGVGKYDVPELEPVDFIPEELVKYNYRGKVRDKSKAAVHFFMYDHLFMSVWKFPDRHIHDFKQFGAIIAPDFSVYYDFPMALQIMAHYRRQWLARYFQEHGVTVIPDVSWCGEMSYDYCFDGIPKNSTVCVSSIGMTKSKEYKKILTDGWKEMLKRLNPSTMLLYGQKLPEMEGNIIQFETCKEQWKK